MYTNLLTNSIEVLKFLVIFNLIFHRRIKEKTGKYTGLIVLVGLLVLMSYVLHSDDQTSYCSNGRSGLWWRIFRIGEIYGTIIPEG